MSRDGARAPKSAISRSMGRYSRQFGSRGEATTAREVVLDGSESDHFAGRSTALRGAEFSFAQFGEGGRHGALRDALRALEHRPFAVEEGTHDLLASRVRGRHWLPRVANADKLATDSEKGDARVDRGDILLSVAWRDGPAKPLHRRGHGHLEFGEGDRALAPENSLEHITRVAGEASACGLQRVGGQNGEEHGPHRCGGRERDTQVDEPDGVKDHAVLEGARAREVKPE